MAILAKRSSNMALHVDLLPRTQLELSAIRPGNEPMVQFWNGIVIAAWTVGLALPVKAQPATTNAVQADVLKTEFSTRSAALERLFSAEAAKGGSYVLRYDRGELSLAKAYGHLDCARTRPMPVEALVDAGSITKAFTYAAVYKLIEEGRLKLDDRLGDIWAATPADKRRVTIAQLLDEQSGFHDFVNPDGSVPAGDVEVITNDYLPLSKQQLLRAAFASPLRFQPGTKQEYSNLAYQLLAAIIEQASGKSYEAYVREKIFLPAGMKNTGYRLADFRSATFAQQCKVDSAWGDPATKGLWKNGVSWNLVGAGGMMTTVHDLKRWTEAAIDGSLFRPDIQSRFRRSPFYNPSSRRCGTELSATAGSNGLTITAYFHLPQRKETLVVSSTRSDHQLPSGEILDILCPR